jgi:hypothetical protein
MVIQFPDAAIRVDPQINRPQPSMHGQRVPAGHVPVRLVGIDGGGLNEITTRDSLCRSSTGSRSASAPGAHVREVNHLTGVITTVAGNGIAGFSGDNGPATAAVLSSPQGLALDATGHLFFADASNARVRELLPGTGVMVLASTFTLTGPSSGTFAGGQSGVLLDQNVDCHQLGCYSAACGRIRRLCCILPPLSAIGAAQRTELILSSKGPDADETSDVQARAFANEFEIFQMD